LYLATDPTCKDISIASLLVVISDCVDAWFEIDEFELTVEVLAAIDLLGIDPSETIVGVSSFVTTAGSEAATSTDSVSRTPTVSTVGIDSCDSLSSPTKAFEPDSVISEEVSEFSPGEQPSNSNKKQENNHIFIDSFKNFISAYLFATHRY